MNNINFVTCFNEDILKQSASYFFNLIEDKWDPSLPLTCYYHDCSTDSYVLPSTLIYESLAGLPEHKKFIETYAEHDGTEGGKIPYNIKLDALRWSHKVFAIANKAEQLKKGWLIWIDADIYLRKNITKEYISSLLNDKADVIALEDDPFFMAFNLNHQPTRDIIKDYKNIYTKGDVIQYREWHDLFILDRLLSLYIDHGLKYETLSKERLHNIFHFKNNYDSRTLSTIRNEKGERLLELSNDYSPDITPGRYRQLIELVKHYKPKTILETGTWNGGRAIEMALAAFEFTDTITYYGFDLFEDATIELDDEENNKKAHNKMSAVDKRLSDFASKMKKEKNKTFNYSLSKGNSRETLSKFNKPHIDFALIGGGNSFKTVESDYNNVKKADIIILDHWFRENDNKEIPDIKYQGVNQLIEKINKTVKVRKEVLPSGDQVLGGGHTHLCLLINNKDLPDTPKSLKQVPIHVNPRDCVPKDYIRNNIKDNIKLINKDKWIPKCRTHSGKAILVSAGPYLDCNKLKDVIKKDPEAKVVCVKHSYPTLLENNIIPWACVVLDPRPITGTSTHGIVRKELFKTIHNKTKFFVASMTDPSVTNYLINHKANIYGWHAFTESLREPEERKKGIHNNTVKLADELGIAEGSTLITGGTCAAMRAIGIMHTMGFRQIDLFGFDCCLKDEPTDEMKKETTGAEDEEPRPKYFQVGVNNKNYWTTGELLAMAQDCENTFKDKGMGINFTFHGENTLVADLWKIAKEQDKFISFKDVFND